MKKLPKIIRNAARCKKCGDTIESRHVHDFKWCTCRSFYVDGGLEYLHRGGDFDLLEDLSEYEKGHNDDGDSVDR